MDVFTEYLAQQSNALPMSGDLSGYVKLEIFSVQGIIQGEAWFTYRDSKGQSSQGRVPLTHLYVDGGMQFYVSNITWLKRLQ